MNKRRISTKKSRKATAWRTNKEIRRAKKSTKRWRRRAWRTGRHMRRTTRRTPATKTGRSHQEAGSSTTRSRVFLLGHGDLQLHDGARASLATTEGRSPPTKTSRTASAERTRPHLQAQRTTSNPTSHHQRAGSSSGATTATTQASPSWTSSTSRTTT